jgi:hypothetical protein
MEAMGNTGYSVRNKITMAFDLVEACLMQIKQTNKYVNKCVIACGELRIVMVLKCCVLNKWDWNIFQI